jgi:hypothetical protein
VISGAVRALLYMNRLDILLFPNPPPYEGFDGK